MVSKTILGGWEDWEDDYAHMKLSILWPSQPAIYYARAKKLPISPQPPIVKQLNDLTAESIPPIWEDRGD